MEEAAEQVASVDNAALVMLTQDGQLGRRVWRLQQHRPLGTVAAVVLDLDPKELLEVAAPDDQQPVQTSARTVRTQRSACAFAVGARTGVRSTGAVASGRSEAG
jgi:hypothetical protein